MKKVTITLLFSLVAVWVAAPAGAVTYVVPGDFNLVSQAINNAEYGDTILLQPGTYTDTDAWFMVEEGITVEGMGSSPAETFWTVPERGGADRHAVSLFTDCHISNLTLATNDAPKVVGVRINHTNAVIDNVIVIPFEYYGIVVSENAEATITNTNVIGGTSAAIFLSTNSNTTVKGCYLADSGEYGIEGPYPGYGTLLEDYNCFDNIPAPVRYYDMSATDIVGSADINPPDYLPPYDSIVVDAGDPAVNDPDLTRSDIGAIWFDQLPLLIGFDEAPGAIPVIGNPIERIFYPGDECRLCYSLTKNEGPPHLTAKSVDAYVVLNAYGTYYWWPTWSQEVDFTAFAISDGDTVTDWVFDFIWPEDTGSAYGLNFLAATTYLDDESNLIVSPVSMLEFGYAE